ncbi:MAG: amidohydrolase [Candidatus Omnitrophica bacterium]|nr:amidohydrolase [Candidatus Omnitrophota bacterium]
MIIDAHSHYMPPEVAEHTAFFKQGWSDVDRQLQMMDEHHIDRAVLLYPTSDAHINMKGWNNLVEVYNPAIAKMVGGHPDRFVGAGIIPYGDSKGLEEALLRVQDLGLTVLSLASSYDGTYLDDKFFDPVWEFASDNKFPVHVHAQIIKPIGHERVEDPLLSPVLEYVMDVTMCLGKLMMSDIFLRYPDIQFIFPHYGGVLPIVKDRFDSTYHMLRKRNYVKELAKPPSGWFQNLFYDMSGSSSVASLMCCLEVAGPEQILFGSDFPANPSPRGALEAARQAGLSENDVANINGNNILRLIQ